MRKHLIFFKSVFAGLLLMGSTTVVHSESLDRIIAVVNDGVITQSEFNHSLQNIKKQLAANNISLPPNDVFRKQVLDQLIVKKLQLQLAEQMNIKITDGDIEKALNTIASQNKFSVSELYEKVTATGMSVKDYRKEIQDALILQQVQQQAVATKINITPQEVEDYMHSKSWQAYYTKEYHLQDILITLSDTPSTQEIEAAKTRADNLLAKLRKHEIDFNNAAAAESGQTNALQGGDLGWRKLPEIPSAFANDLPHMKANDLVGPVQTPNGFHILLLAGVRSIASQMKPEEQRTQVQQLIFQRKLEEALQSWTAKIRSDAYINMNPEK